MASSHCTAGASATSLRSKARSVPQPQHHAAPHGHHAWAPGVENPQLHVLNRISSKVALQICRESRSDPSQSPARTCPVSRHPRPHDDTSLVPLPGPTELRERALAWSDSAVAAPSFPPSNPSPVPACPQHALTRLPVLWAAEIPARRDLGRMRMEPGSFPTGAAALAAPGVRSLPFYQHMPRLLTPLCLQHWARQDGRVPPLPPAAPSQQATGGPDRGTLPDSPGPPPPAAFSSGDR